MVNDAALFTFKMAKTYGDKPVSFQLEENGEYWCIGSEVRLGGRQGRSNSDDITGV